MDPTIEPAERQVDEIESLCMNCHKDGTTRLLLTRIPFFREIIIMSFSCPHCHFQNNEIQSAGEIQQRGISFTFKLDSKSDLERQIVKSDTCVFRIEDIDLEIPPGRGQLTNIEGILSMIRQDLAGKQEERRQVDEGLHQKIQAIIDTISSIISGERPATLTLDDPAGNSTVEPSPSDRPGKYKRTEYPRTAAQNASLGLAPGEQPTNNTQQSSQNGDAPPTEIRPEYHANAMYPSMPPREVLQNITDDDDIVENEVYSFPSTCPGCTKPCATNMKFVRIPHFEEVVIMSTVCQHCGYRSNEVKSGGKVPEKGRRITLNIQNQKDLSRDILKAESCSLACPELHLTVEPGTLGGRFTTVEGLLTQVRDDLRASIFDTGDDGAISQTGGDSMPSADKVKWTEFFALLDRGISGEMPFTVVLEDPMAASYVQSFSAPEVDPQIEVEDYERTAEEEETLGLRDIKTEGYEVDNDGHAEKEEGGHGEENGTAEAPHPIDTDEIQREVQARLAALATDDTDGQSDDR